jgi:Protein of unknown function (DUF3822)
MESVIGKAIERICLLFTSTFKLFIVVTLSISKQKYLILLAKIHALNIDFKISPLINNIANTHLLAEVGNNAISFLVYEKTPFCCIGFFMHKIESDFSTKEYTETINSILVENDVLKSNFASTKVLYNCTNATLMPTQFYVDAEKENILNLMFGENTNTYCFKESVKGNEMKLVYSIPANLYEFINNQFPKNSFSHATSLQIDGFKNTATILKCIVYNHSIKLLLFVDGNIHLAQFFNYETPTDVSYHLLNVCERFKVDVKNINVELSGLIEAKSNLYQDIYKYFLNISFASLDNSITITEELNVLPNHYYSPLVELALCV